MAAIHFDGEEEQALSGTAKKGGAASKAGKVVRKACCKLCECITCPLRVMICPIVTAVVLVVSVIVILSVLLGSKETLMQSMSNQLASLQSTALSYISSDANTRLWRRSFASAALPATPWLSFTPGFYGWIDIQQDSFGINLTASAAPAGTVAVLTIRPLAGAVYNISTALTPDQWQSSSQQAPGLLSAWLQGNLLYIVFWSNGVPGWTALII